MERIEDEPATDSYLPTRQSLLSRLQDWEDQAGWREFFELYWRLIYKVARKSGLQDDEAQDVVQSTFIYLSRRMPGFRYDASRGSFKSWLRVVTRSRIAVYCRKAKREQNLVREPLPDNECEDAEQEFADPAGEVLDELWQREWEAHTMEAALRRVRAKVSSQQLLIFQLATQLPAGQVARKLEVSLAQVYLARHRVGKLLKQEISRIRAETE